MKFKKNNSGMSLVEVVVAMSVFSFMTLAITMAFSASMKYGMRNVKRDQALSTQQTALEKGMPGGLEVYNDSFKNKKTIKFIGQNGTADMQAVTGSTAFSSIAEYNAKATANAQMSDINFQLKTFSSVALGTSLTSPVKSMDRYTFEFSNMSDKTVDVIIELNNVDRAYLGDYDTGYVHKSPVYTITLPAYDPTVDAESEMKVEAIDGTTLIDSIPSDMNLGLEMPPPEAGEDEPNIKVSFRIDGSVYQLPNLLTRTTFYNDPDGKIKYRYNGTTFQNVSNE
ncbi:Type II secretory pathway, pseudopilin PulG [Ruminococcus sp. YE71]|uniref:type II secretion system protein n=1 Tax=unclassified Ruminococcus TaxID=2608920 RepID=UPI00087F31A1|nr:MULTISPECIES: type II secretion system protein [unclassified Ruminococcus]SDA09524.1 Type II secretory pathway, pseudopilin PulG [Ruminococcus sp. YE78]SFW12067.1 Type II secretory pathway, pseudopilin PulG [Ruminococcus sp. YE71]